MLHAYVDGHLDAQQRAEVDRRLAADPQLRRRVHDQGKQRAGLRDALSFKLEERVPFSLSLAALAEAWLRRAAPPVARWRIAAGFLPALGLGAASGWFGYRKMPFDEIALRKMEFASAYRIFAMTRPAPSRSAPPTGRR